MSLPQLPGYEFQELLGEGGCGASYLCRHESGLPRVVKVLNGLAVNPHLLNHALGTVSRAGEHPHLIPIHQFNLQQAPYYYASDFYGLADGKPATLHVLLGRLKRDGAWLLIEQIVGALAFLHLHDVIHTSVKPGNIFVQGREDAADRYDIRLGDYGQGLVAGIHYFELGDSGFYASPEQLRDGDFSHGKGKRWDVYSFGVVAFQLLNGCLPRLDAEYRRFTASRSSRANNPTAALHQDDPARFAEAIAAEPEISWPAKAKNEYEEQLRAVIDRCLRIDPATRPVDLREVARALESIRHTADVELLKAQHHAQLRSKIIKSRTLLGTTAIFFLTSVLLLVSAVIGFTQFGRALVEIDQAENRRKGDLARQEKIFNEKVTHEEQLRLTAQAERAVVASREEEARAFLQYSQAQADRFFASVLAAGDVDFPGFQADRRARLEDAVTYFERFRSTYGKDPLFAREFARAHRFLAEIHLSQGRLSQAEQDFTRAKIAINQLPLEPDEEAEYAITIAAIDRQLADIEILRGDHAKAVAALEQSTARFENLARMPESGVTPLDLLANRHRLANILQLDGQDAQALDAFTEIADDLVALIDASGDDEQKQSLLGSSYLQMAEMYLEKKDRDTANQFFEKAAEIFGALVARNGQIDEYQFQLALCLNREGSLSSEVQPILDAHALLDRIVRLNPTDHRYRLELASSYGRLARLQRDAGETAQAIDLNNIAIQILTALLEEEPGVDRYKFALAKQNMDLAKLLGDSEDYRDAADRLEASITVFEELLVDEAGNNEYLTVFAKAQGNAGYLLEKLGDDQRAKIHYESAREAWERLLDHAPEDPEAEEGLAWVQDQLRRA